MAKYFIFVLMFLYSLDTIGQGAIEKQRKLNDKFFFGANLGLQFGSITAIDISPMVGYIPADNLYVGLKGKYEYYNNSIYSTSTSIYGGGIFAMYDLFKSVIAYGEYEILSLETAYFYPYQAQNSGDRYWQHTPLLGGGFLQSLGGRSKLMLLLLWNFNDDYGNYYSNPIFRVSFLF